MKEIDHYLLKIAETPKVSLRAKFLIAQKMLRMSFSEVLGNSLSGVHSQVGREPDEPLWTYLERRADQRKEIDYVELGRYILEKQLAPPDELRALEVAFVSDATGQHEV